MANADVFAALGKKPMAGMQTTYDEGAETGPIESAAPSAPVAPPAEPTETGRFAGSGRYEYAKMSDGTIKITKSPRGGAGTVVGADSPFYDLIMTDIEKFNAPGAKAPAAKPAAPKAAAPAAPSKAPSKAAPSASAMPEARGRNNAPSGQSMQETEAERLMQVDAGSPEDRYATSTEDARMGESEDEVANAMLDLPTSVAGAPAPKPMSEADKRRELAQYGNSIPGSIKRAGLADDARAGLVRTKLDPTAADATVRQLMGSMMKGDYNAYMALKGFAKL